MFGNRIQYIVTAFPFRIKRQRKIFYRTVRRIGKRVIPCAGIDERGGRIRELVHHVLEIVVASVVLVVLHIVDDALSRRIRPSIGGAVIVQTVLQLPCIKVLPDEILVSVMYDRFGGLIEHG